MEKETLLQVAAQLMAAHITGSVHAGFPYKSEEVAAEAIRDAIALIDVYNKSLPPSISETWSLH